MTQWDEICSEMNFSKEAVPLFETTPEQGVKTMLYGKKHPRKVLQRSAAMEAQLNHIKGSIEQDYQSQANQIEGLLYLMFWQCDSKIVPLYIGKAEKVGKTADKLSDTITQASEFMRWGYDHDSHLGDLSAWVCAHAEKHKRPNYLRWAQCLFLDFPAEQPQLRYPTWFWAEIYPAPGLKGSLGTLKEAERSWIAAAAAFSPETLVNVQGR